jgi:hypothetical protein
MKQTTMQRDITTAVQRALLERRDLHATAGLVRQSDALLATLPSVRGSQQPTTAGFLWRYHTPLHQELCHGTQPHAPATTVEDELQDLTRAVLVTVGTSEALSIDAAVGLALVLYTRGLAPFCAVPTRGSSTT